MIALVANAFLGLILIEINHHMSLLSLQLLIPASFVLYAGLNMRYGPGLFVCIIAGLMQDAAVSTPYGYFTITLPVIHFVLHRLSPKLHKDGGVDSILITQGLNLIVLLHLSFHFQQEYPGSFLSVFIQVIASQLLLLLVGPAHLAVQIALSTAFGVEANDEEPKSA